MCFLGQASPVELKKTAVITIELVTLTQSPLSQIVENETYVWLVIDLFEQKSSLLPTQKYLDHPKTARNFQKIVLSLNPDHAKLKKYISQENN